MLSINDFEIVKFEDKDIFNNWFEKYPQDHSDYLFSTIISWIDYAKYHYTIYKDSLIIFTMIDDIVRIRPPVGKINKPLFDEIIGIAKSTDAKYPIGAINKQTKEWIMNNYKLLKVLPHREYFDYVYLSSDLADLIGARYSKIRNRLNKFKRKYDYEIEIIGD